MNKPKSSNGGMVAFWVIMSLGICGIIGYGIL